MIEYIVTGAVAAGLVLLTVLVLLCLILFRLNKHQEIDIERIEDELIRLFQISEDHLKQGFSESRKELREMSFENRREISDLFKSLQDSLLNRIAENSSMQIRQLELFKNSLNELSINLINNSNDFKPIFQLK